MSLHRSNCCFWWWCGGWKLLQIINEAIPVAELVNELWVFSVQEGFSLQDSGCQAQTQRRIQTVWFAHIDYLIGVKLAEAHKAEQNGFQT